MQRKFRNKFLSVMLIFGLFGSPSPVALADDDRPKGVKAEQWIRLSENFGLLVIEINEGSQSSTKPKEKLTQPGSSSSSAAPSEGDIYDSLVEKLDEITGARGIHGEFYVKVKGAWYRVSTPFGDVAVKPIANDEA